MKIFGSLFLVLATLLVLGACVGSPDTPDPDQNGFVFEEEEIAEEEDGFDFTDDEVADEDTPSNSQPDEIELEDQVIPAEDDIEIPQWGEWLVHHDEGTLICDNVIIFTFPAGDDETVLLELSESREQIYFSGFTDYPGRMIFTLDFTGPGGAQYISKVTPPNGEPIEFLFTFFHFTENSPYDLLEGIITSKAEDCTVNRSFSAQPIN